MNFIKTLVIFILLIMAVIYGLMFTSQGNSLIKPIIEDEISKKISIPVKLETFNLKPDSFKIVLVMNDKSYIASKGSFNVLAQSLKLYYDINIDELSSLKRLIGKKLNGSFKTNGTIEGDRFIIHINGKTDFANSDTLYHIELKEFEPKNIKATIKHIQIDRLLYAMDQPIYTNGTADIKVDIKSFEAEKLDGRLKVKIDDSTLNPESFMREFGISIPPDITINARLNTKLKGEKIISNLNALSTISNISSQTITYNLKKNYLKADYRLEIPNLDNLYFITNKHMQGDIIITGNVKKAKNLMQLTGHTDTLGGVVNFIFKNKKLKANIKNIQTIALTDMLLYPHIFDSRANAKIEFDTKVKKGTLHAETFDGQILPNELSFLTKQLTNFDITKEIYEYTVLDTKIEDKQLLSNLHMKSRYTEIRSKDAIIDLDKETIDTKLNINIKESIIPVTIVGQFSKPSIKIDGNELIKKRAVKEIEKRLPKELKNFPIKDLIKNLF